MFCVIRRYFLKIPSYYNTEAFLLQAGLSDFSIEKVKIRYCSHGYVPRGVFVCFLRENPELHGAELRFMQFLCIAERVTVRSAPLSGGV